MEFATGDLVWVPDETRSYLACKVVKGFKCGESGSVVVLEKENEGDERSGTELVVSSKASDLVLKMDSQSCRPVENMVELKELNEAAILHNLRIRFATDDIYTSVGTILVAVNPFKLLPLYTPEVLERYRKMGAKQSKPHIFAIADNAYNSMVSLGEDQSCIISGESGAGKTETTKLFLQYLTEISAPQSKNTPESMDSSVSTGRSANSFRIKGGLQEEILQANPLMEAFGNAKTVRNNNSSRFGKWIEIRFDTVHGSMKGGKITSYLLEKSRLVHQSEGERNYHIFYQLCAGAKADKALKDQLELGEADEYHYLNQSDIMVIEGTNDEANWEKVRRAMTVMKISCEESDQVLQILAGILHLGNIEFHEIENNGDGEAKISNPGVLSLCARQLGVEMHVLEKVLTSRSMGVRSIIQKPYTKEEALDARDALAKAIYGQLFEWLISKINICLRDEEEFEQKDSGSNNDVDESVSTHRAIGVLDIFGFESFTVNSFEQLCINYCNEKLQLHFNEHIFKLEQSEYTKEGLDIKSIAFVDNQPCVDLLESKAGGIFSMIDEEISIPKGSDSGFLNKVLQRVSSSPDILRRPSVKEIGADKCFVVCHYAGPVSYNVGGFLEKNKDALHGDLLTCMLISSLSLMKEFFDEFDGDRELATKNTRGNRSSSRARSKTIGSKFKDQLQLLLKTLSQTSPHFIRCVKPNNEKVGDLFDSPMVLSQLRCAGLLEVCRIRQVGFPVRFDFPSVVRRYACIVQQFSPSGDFAADANNLCKLLANEHFLQSGMYQLGKSKLFMKNEQQLSLESLRANALRTIATRLQATVRMLTQRRIYLEWKNLLLQLDRSQEIESLSEAIECCSDLPYGAKHLKAMKSAQARLERLHEENRVCELLRGAIGSLDMVTLNKAIEAAREINLTHSFVQEARDALDKVQKAKTLRAELDVAMSNRDLETLEQLVAKATAELGLVAEEDDKLRKASIMLDRLKSERQLMSKLQATLSSCKDPDQLGGILDEITDLGLPPSDLYTKAQDVYQILFSVREALTQRNYGKLQASLFSPDLPPSNRPDEALKLLEQLKLEEAVRGAVESGNLDSARDAMLCLTKDTPREFRDDFELKIRKLQIVHDIDVACSENDTGRLQGIVSLAADMNMKREDFPSLNTAHKILESSGEDSKIISEISASLVSRDINRLRQIAEEARSKGKVDLSQRAVEESLRLASDLELAAQLENCVTLEQVTDICKASRSDLAPKAIDAARKAEKLLADPSTEKAALLAVKETLVECSIPAMAERVELAVERFESRQELEKQLREAMTSNDQSKMLSLVDEIENTYTENIGGVSSSSGATPGTHHRVQSKLVESCKSILNRGAKLDEVSQELQLAMDEDDLDKLNDALTKMIEIGASFDEELLSKAHDQIIKLEVQREECANLVAEIRVLKSKATSSKGIQSPDLVPVREALQALGPERDFSEIRRAKELLNQMETQLLVQQELSSALQVCSYKALKRALELAQEHDLESLEIVGRVRQELRSKDMERRAAQRAAHEAGVPYLDKDGDGLEGASGVFEEKSAGIQQRRRSQGADVGDVTSDDGEAEFGEEEEKNLLERRDRARNNRFDFIHYDKIRSDENFAKGTFLLNKSRAKKDKCIYQTYVINKSMLDFGSDKQLNKLAVGVHKAILGYCGDKSMAFPATLARDVLVKGLETPDLVDEIYVQLCKHLTLNPRVESVGRAWQLICMAVGTFPPSHDFELYLLNFLLRHMNIPGLIGNYATFALRRLEGIISTGSSGFLPSIDEIQAYNDRPPILARIELVDGTVLAEELPVTPDLDVGKVNEICVHFLSLKDPRSDQFGITVDGKIPLRKCDFMGDEFVLATRKDTSIRFVFQRIIVLKMSGRDEPSLIDPMFNRLVYLQAQAEFVQGRFNDLSDDEIFELVAQALAVDHGENLPDNLVEGCGLAGYVPPAPCCKDLRQAAEEISKVYRDSQFGALDSADLQEMFVRKLQVRDHYGRILFPTEQDVVFEVDSSGVYFGDTSVSFPSLYRWGGSARTFTIVLWNPETQDEKEEITLRTNYGTYIGGALLEMINHIMSVVDADDSSGGEEDEECEGIDEEDESKN